MVRMERNSRSRDGQEGKMTERWFEERKEELFECNTEQEA